MKRPRKISASARLISIALFVGIPATIVSLTAMSWVQIGEDSLAIAQREAQLAALTKRLNSPAADGKPQDLSAIYIPGSTGTLAGANLQRYIVDQISIADARVIETSFVDTEPSDDQSLANEIKLKATLDVDNSGLLNLLYELETGLPLLDVVTMSVHRLPDGEGDGDALLMRVDLTVKGRWRQGPT